MLSPNKLLENARNRIAKRENYVKGRVASRRKDAYTDYSADQTNAATLDPQATCWCSLGSLATEAGYNIVTTPGSDILFVAEGENPRLLGLKQTETHPHFREAYRALQAAATSIWRERVRPIEYEVSPYDINDGMTHEDTLDMFDRAIASLKGE